MARWKKDTYDKMKSELMYYYKRGVLLYLEEEQCSPKKIARAQMVAESGTYMGDYITNEEGKVQKIKFQYVVNR